MTSRFWQSRDRSLERELRAARPEPPGGLVEALAARVHEAEPRFRPARLRLALVGAVTTALLVGVACVGGLGYAATAAKSAARTLHALGTPRTGATGGEAGAARRSASGDQYQPGFGWGDPNHNHAGAPGLSQVGSVRQSSSPGATTLTGRVVLDEQATLFISVVGPDGRRIPFSAAGDGRKVKTHRYRVLVPRTLRLRLVVAGGKLAPGESYGIRIRAVDPNGQVATIVLPFTA